MASFIQDKKDTFDELRLSYTFGNCLFIIKLYQYFHKWYKLNFTGSLNIKSLSAERLFIHVI